MKKLSLDLQFLSGFLSEQEIDDAKEQVEHAENILTTKTGKGGEFLGWLTLPEEFDKEELRRVAVEAERVRLQSQVVVVVGIGGSYLGARAAIECLGHSFANQIAASRDWPEIYFCGINISSRYVTHLLEVIGDRDFSIIVISKSGTTTEPAISFRLLKKKLFAKYGPDASGRIIAITDRKKGALKALADERGFSTFVVPDDIGGRFSVLTPVGLLPIAISGINVQAILDGAREACSDFRKPYPQNDCLKYSAIRNLLLSKGRIIEMLVTYEPSLISLAEWWKQLFGESEGKDGRGIFPASASFTMDLHSMGQYIQDGPRHLFETLINIQKDSFPLKIPFDQKNLDGLNYIAGKTMHEVNEKAIQGTLQAHVEGRVPNIVIQIPEMNAFNLGYLFYFFEKACAVSGYMLGVNPFNQPGVEAYKRNMFRLLGKEGY